MMSLLPGFRCCCQKSLVDRGTTEPAVTQRLTHSEHQLLVFWRSRVGERGRSGLLESRTGKPEPTHRTQQRGSARSCKRSGRSPRFPLHFRQCPGIASWFGSRRLPRPRRQLTLCLMELATHRLRAVWQPWVSLSLVLQPMLALQAPFECQDAWPAVPLLRLASIYCVRCRDRDPHAITRRQRSSRRGKCPGKP